MSDEAGSGYLRGVVTGLLLGAAAALLLAPKPGGELRHDLAEGASKLKDKADDLRHRGGDLASNQATGEQDALADAADYAETAKEEDRGEEHDVVESV